MGRQIGFGKQWRSQRVVVEACKEGEPSPCEDELTRYGVGGAKIDTKKLEKFGRLPKKEKKKRKRQWPESGRKSIMIKE